MVARAAEWNTSVFRSAGKEEVMVVIKKYLELAIQFDYPYNIVKYCLQQLLGSLQDSELGRNFLNCSTLGDLASWGGLGEIWKTRQQELRDKEGGGQHVEFSKNRDRNGEGREGCNKRKLEDGDEVTEMCLPFVRGHFGSNDSCRLPKSLLLLHCRQSHLEQPQYR